jgi:hypothetical protein
VVVDSGFGLFAKGGPASFDSVTVTTNDPAATIAEDPGGQPPLEGAAGDGAVGGIQGMMGGAPGPAPGPSPTSSDEDPASEEQPVDGEAPDEATTLHSSPWLATWRHDLRMPETEIVRGESSAESSDRVILPDWVVDEDVTAAKGRQSDLEDLKD